MIRSKSLRSRKKQIQLSNDMQIGNYEERLKYLEENIERNMRLIGGGDVLDRKIAQLRREIREVDRFSRHYRTRKAI